MALILKSDIAVIHGIRTPKTTNIRIIANIYAELP
jgi:hypothetical protein